MASRFLHYCSDWDFAEIDETCGEFACCTHFPGDQEADRIKDSLNEHVDRLLAPLADILCSPDFSFGDEDKDAD